MHVRACIAEQRRCADVAEVLPLGDASATIPVRIYCSVRLLLYRTAAMLCGSVMMLSHHPRGCPKPAASSDRGRCRARRRIRRARSGVLVPLEHMRDGGRAVQDSELIEYLSESCVMSKSVDDYGERKSSAITTARRLAAFLGDDRLKDKGLVCNYVIAQCAPPPPCAKAAI